VSAFDGTGALVRLVLRRDRVVLPLWVVVLGSLPIFYASATMSLFPTAAERATYAQGLRDTPAELALVGPVFGSSAGALSVWRSGFLLVLLALASALTVVRHTRVEEEAGRRELLGATVVGRQAPLTAALLVTLAADLAVGAIAAAGLPAVGIVGAGNIVFGLGLAVCGLTFAGVAAVTAQMFETAAAARGAALATLGGAFLLRAVGDAVGGSAGSRLSWLSWLSPIGWVQRTRPYAGERWWILLLPLVLAIVLLAAAQRLTEHRDVGGGLFASRPGPARAAASLRSALALAWRLHARALLGWTVGFAVMGLVLGAAANSVDEQFGTNQRLTDLLARLGGNGAMTDAFLASAFAIMAFAAAGYTVSATLRLRAEETALRAEPLLATGVRRLGWAASHLVFAFGGAAFVVLITGLSAGLAVATSTGDAGEVLRLVGAALAQLPAVWVLTGLAVALVGLAPRWSSAAWGALAVFLLLGQIGEVLDLDPRLLDVSPFTHVPKLPGGHFSATPLFWLLGVAIALSLAGLAGLRRRDIG
jgi:ABC-2 type transport system permease protein